jgi:hypothetical protein
VGPEFASTVDKSHFHFWALQASGSSAAHWTFVTPDTLKVRDVDISTIKEVGETSIKNSDDILTYSEQSGNEITNPVVPY